MDNTEKDNIRRKVMDVIEYGIDAPGRKAFINCLYGDNPRTKERIEAYCYDCMGWYADGIQDCKNKDCPLYAHMPFNSLIALPERSRADQKAINTEFPMEERIYPKSSTCMIGRTPEKAITNSLLVRKLKTRKYPKEITQKPMEKVPI